MRKWIMGIIGMVLVGGSAMGFAMYMKSYELDVTTMDTYKPVNMIKAGDLITKSMVRKVSIPTVQHMENAIVDMEQIIGKRAIVPIGESEEFLSWKIGEDTLYPRSDEFYIGFKMDFVGAVNNMVRRGDKVDVWVEYTQPKMYDANGVEIDQAEQARRIAVDPTQSAKQAFKKIYNSILIEGLTVAYVKDQDGIEITDAGDQTGLTLPGTSGQRDEANAERYRQNASGQPSYITFIMTEKQYSKFVEGTKEGTIRLGLPSSSTIVGTIVMAEPNAAAEQEKQKDIPDNRPLNSSEVLSPVSPASTGMIQDSGKSTTESDAPLTINKPEGGSPK